LQQGFGKIIESAADGAYILRTLCPNSHFSFKSSEARMVCNQKSRHTFTIVIGHINWASRLFFLILVLGAGIGISGCAVHIASPPPTVTISLSATTIHAGESATLMWSSTGATACTTSGAWSGSEQTSGTLSVTQNAPLNYAYTLACSGAGGNTSGSAVLTVTPHILADANASGALINVDQFGSNMCGGCDINVVPSLGPNLKSIGVNLLRWPAGTLADEYHWQTNTWSGTTSGCGQATPPASSFAIDNFESALVAPGHFDVTVTLNYSTNANCTAGADPNESALLVAHAKAQNYGILHWTVGNEVYGNFEPDLNVLPHDPATYSNLVATQYYPLIKAQDPLAHVGIVVNAGGVPGVSGPASWDSKVLPAAKYDYVEVHFYPQPPGTENDSFLLTQAPANIAVAFSTLQQELATAGHPNTPIFLGEYNSVASNPGKQTVSIVNALYVGMIQGEIMKAGISRAVIHRDTGGGCITSGNNSSTLYGWQNFGSDSLFADNSAACPANVPLGTIFPEARAFGLSALFGVAGNHMLGSSISTALPNVRAYVAQQGAGYSVMLFNLDQNNATTITVGIANAAAKSYTANMSTYDKAIYDQSLTGIWAPPITQALGTVTLPMTVTLQPWSMNVITIQ
jgi:hypothetical protein